MARKQPTTQEKLSAALLALDACRCKLDPTLQALVDREKARTMTPKEIERKMNLEWDHQPIPVAWGGTNHPTNLMPLRKADHREKTNTDDIKKISKVRRSLKTEKFVVKKNETRDELVDRLWNEKPKRKAKWASKPLPGAKSEKYRGVDGKVRSRSSRRTSKLRPGSP